MGGWHPPYDLTARAWPGQSPDIRRHPTSHPEIAAEQAVVDRAYARLDAMRASARVVSDEVMDLGAGGTHQARLERDVKVLATDRRLAALAVGEAGLCFGRTDGVNGETLYIGRIGISDADNEQLVVDWRAPAAESFYRATGGEPMGLVRRRHFILRARRLVGLDDELLGDVVGAGDHGGEPGEENGSGLVLMGEGALMAALGRTRSGRMSDIVATIQREQDEIVRAPLPGILVVQGGPGTGKTAIALHRAAYLLYTHRFPLERAGMLLIGPSRIFLRYIEAVLPALGEDAATLATPVDLVPTEVAGEDGPEVARIKGDLRMARVVAQAVRDRQRALPRAVAVLWRGRRLVLSKSDSRRVVEQAGRSRGANHNQRRRQVERIVANHLIRQLGSDQPEGDSRVEMEEAVLADPVIVEALERMWPVLTPEELLHDLFGWPALIRLAGRGVLDDSEVALLYRPRSTRARLAPWTTADMALLDEAAVVLGPPPRSRAGTSDGEAAASSAWSRERVLEGVGPLDEFQRRELLTRMAAADAEGEAEWASRLRPWERTYGHVVVDEAQDLTPMQLRMIGRRCPGGSMTVVGDLGQATGAWAPASWDDVVAHLPGRRPARRVDLTVNYRTPTEVAVLAAAVLAVAAPDLVAPRPVREAGVDPVFTRVSTPDPQSGAATEQPDLHLVEAVARAAAHESEAVGDGRVGVIAPVALLDRLRAALPGAAASGPERLDAPVAVLSVLDAKGLEFDSVCLVEPSAIVAERANGARALYVALTRTTRRLHVVHARALPPGLSE